MDEAPHVATGFINFILKVCDENGNIVSTNCPDTDRIFSEIVVTGKDKQDCINNVKNILKDISKNEFVKIGML